MYSAEVIRTDKWMYLLDFSPSSLALSHYSQKRKAWEEAVFVFPIALYRVSGVKHQLKNTEVRCIKGVNSNLHTTRKKDEKMLISMIYL